MSRSTRRSFLKKAGAATIAAPLFVRNLMSQPPSRRVRHASFGADGMAGSDIGSIASHPNVTFVAVADVDTARQVQARKRFGDRVRLIDTLGAVSVIGAGINASFQNLRRGSDALAASGIIAQHVATSSFRITWMIDRSRLDDAVGLLHATFINPGTV